MFLSLIVIVLGYAGLYIQPSGYSLMGVRTSIVRSGSMSGTFEPGDIIVSYYHNNQIYTPGDIVTFKRNNSVVTHRITRESITEDGAYFTRGDSNSVDDGETLNKEQIIGKYLFKIPMLGFLAAKLQTDTGLIGAICFILVFLLLGAIIREWKENSTIKGELSKNEEK